VTGRFGPRTSDAGSTSVPRAGSRLPSVRLSGASMRFLEAGLALGAIATAILIGVGR
jgi:hypothetical protein